MSQGITLETAKAHLGRWLDADLKVSAGQAAEIAGRTLTRVNAAEIRENITYWQGWVTRLSRGGGARFRAGVPS